MLVLEALDLRFISWTYLEKLRREMDERSHPKSVREKNKKSVCYFFMYFTESIAKIFGFSKCLLSLNGTEDSYLFWVLSTTRNTEKLHWIAELHHCKKILQKYNEILRLERFCLFSQLKYRKVTTFPNFLSSSTHIFDFTFHN